MRLLLANQMKRRILQVLYAPWMPRDLLFCAWHGLAWDPGWRLQGLPLVQRARGSHISIGQRFVACSSSRHNSLGVSQRVIIKATGPGSRVHIGDDVGCSGCTVSAAVSVTIGHRVLLGSGCLICDSDFHPLHPDDRHDHTCTMSQPVVIEDDVFIGARAIILRGVRVGAGSVVGAGAVVTHDVPPMVVVAGNPAQVVRQLNPRSARPVTRVGALPA